MGRLILYLAEYEVLFLRLTSKIVSHFNRALLLPACISAINGVPLSFYASS